MNDPLQKIYDAVIDCDKDAVVESINHALSNRIEPLVIFGKLNEAIKSVGDRFGRGEVFITSLVGSAEAMKAGVAIIEPLILKDKGEFQTLGKVVMATAEGDIHDIGKNIVITMLRAAGFGVLDLGIDVSTEKIVETIRKENPQVVGVSTLLTTTASAQEKLIKRLLQEELRDKVKVIVGGAATTKEWSERIGADGYAADGFESVNLVKRLIGVP
jgi:corrinoid protein of di/trimethylamine methyltransferase